MGWPKGKPRKKQEAPIVTDDTLKRLEGMVGEAAAREIAALRRQVADLEQRLSQIATIAGSAERRHQLPPAAPDPPKEPEPPPDVAPLAGEDTLGEGRWV